MEHIANIKSKVYIKVDERNRVIEIDGGYSVDNIKNINEWVFIDEGIGDKYNLCQTHYLETSLFEQHGVPLYELKNNKVIRRNAKDVIIDINNLPPKPPTITEQIEIMCEAINELAGMM